MNNADSFFETTNPSTAAQQSNGGQNNDAGAFASPAAVFTARIAALEQQLAAERQFNARMAAIMAVEPARDTALDTEQFAQQLTAALAKVYDGALIVVFQCQPDMRLKPLSVCATGASASVLASGDTLPREVLVLAESAAQQGALLHETALQIGETNFPSCISAPIQAGGSRLGLLLLASPAPAPLQPGDVQVAQAAAAQMGRALAYTNYAATLTSFEQSIANLSMVESAGSLLEMIASTARRTLGASCTFAATLYHNEWLVRGAGKAPLLFHALQTIGLSFLEEAMHSPYTFRLRDLRNDPAAGVLVLDKPGLCSLLASPIRTNGVPSGVLLAFGKIDDSTFQENDVFLAELLTSHAAFNLESSYRNQELRNKLNTTQLLYELGLRIVQSETLAEAAEGIVRAAYQLLQARRCGLLLFTADGRQQAEAIYPKEARGSAAPVELVAQAMNSRQSIFLSESEQAALVAIPLQTTQRCFGGLWIELLETGSEARQPIEDLQFLVNQASIALERSILLDETRQQAHKLTRAYVQLNDTYEQTLMALMRTLDARDRETEGHSERVTRMAVQLGIEMGLSKTEQKALEHGALLHDIGKIGVSDTILLKRGTLTDEEWQQMRRHPEIGARIIQEIPALHDALPVIAFHHERWDGSGYPLRLAGDAIPLLARLFAVVDVFDALTRARPYRSTVMTLEQALAYLQAEAGQLFDPVVVARFVDCARQPAQTSASSTENEPSSA